MIKNCKNCQQEFDGKPHQHYCSGKCKVRHHRARQQDDPGAVSGTKPANPAVRFDDPARSEIEMGINLEIKRLELEHQERSKLLDMQENERLRQQEAEDRERQNQHEFDLAEMASIGDLARAKEQLAQLKAEKESQRERADRAERESVSKVPSNQDEQEEEIEQDEGNLWKLGAIAMGAVLLMNWLNDKKPVPPLGTPLPKPKPKLGTL
jgi:hypothetical protein